MKDIKFIQGDFVRTLREIRDGMLVIPANTLGVVTNVYNNGTIRVASDVSKNYQWEAYSTEKQLIQGMYKAEPKKEVEAPKRDAEENKPTCFGQYNIGYDKCNNLCPSSHECFVENFNKLKKEVTEAPKNHVTEGKPKMSYLPMDLLALVTKAYELGAKKDYPRNSFRQGFLVSTLIDAARRHDKDFFDVGETFDKQGLEEYDIEVYHSACIIFNHLCILDTLINHPELDDRHVILDQKQLLKEQDTMVDEIIDEILEEDTNTEYSKPVCYGTHIKRRGILTSL